MMGLKVGESLMNLVWHGGQSLDAGTKVSEILDESWCGQSPDAGTKLGESLINLAWRPVT